MAASVGITLQPIDAVDVLRARDDREHAEHDEQHRGDREKERVGESPGSGGDAVVPRLREGSHSYGSYIVESARSALFGHWSWPYMDAGRGTETWRHHRPETKHHWEETARSA